jgi:hypothetical protein
VRWGRRCGGAAVRRRCGGAAAVRRCGRGGATTVRRPSVHLAAQRRVQVAERVELEAALPQVLLEAARPPWVGGGAWTWAGGEGGRGGASAGAILGRPHQAPDYATYTIYEAAVRY